MNEAKKSREILFWAIISFFFLIGCRSFVLPSADGTGPDPSPPTLTGTIIEISQKKIVLISNNNKVQFSVEITDETYIFSEFGGFLTPEELKTGEMIKVWIKKKNREKNNTPFKAAAIEVETQ